MSARRRRQAIIPAALLFALLLYSYGCVPKRINDLRAVDVSRESAAVLPPTQDMRDWLTQRGEAVWKVTLRGDAGWIGEVRSHELNSYPVVARCDHRDWELLALGPYVGQAEVTYGGQGFDRLPVGPGYARYEVYLPESGRYRSVKDFNAKMPPYDLSRERLPLCISIAGGAMTGAYNRSNEVRIAVGLQPNGCVPVLPGWATPDGNGTGITSNTVRVRGSEVWWNGAAVDEATLTRYLRLTSRMFPMPFVIFDPETKDFVFARLVRDVVDHNYPCRDGACGQGTREAFGMPR